MHRRGGRHRRPPAALPGLEPRLPRKHLQRAVRAGRPDHRPAALIAARVPARAALLAAELPIVVVEAALAAICSFTLVAPLGIPWWAPLVAFTAMAALFGVMQRVDRKSTRL